MGIVIRVAYSNGGGGWNGPCLHPLADRSAFEQCIKQRVDVGEVREDENGYCVSSCWEKNLVRERLWHNVLGDWGFRAHPGTSVFFVFRQPNRLFCLWGKTKVKNTNGKEIIFEHFQPLPDAQRVRDLTAHDLVGKDWKQGFYRYISSLQEERLERLMEGGQEQSDEYRQPDPVGNAPTHLRIEFKSNIAFRLQRMASEQGREVEDVVREAVAEWLKGRES